MRTQGDVGASDFLLEMGVHKSLGVDRGRIAPTEVSPVNNEFTLNQRHLVRYPLHEVPLAIVVREFSTYSILESIVEYAYEG